MAGLIIWVAVGAGILAWGAGRIISMLLSTLTAFLIAGLLVALTRPFVRFMVKRGLGRGWAAAIASIAALIVIVGVVTMFGAWDGGLTGIASESKKLKKFRHDIEACKFLILIYARKQQGAAVRALMRAKHPEAELVAVNLHFINPFKPVRRRHRAPRGHESAL
jgi:predicted PurR-regulated permease PerM